MAVQRVQVDNPVGTNKDLAPSLLPPEVWTDSLNVAFRFNKTTSAPGYSSVFGDEPDGGIFYMLQATTGTDLYWYEGGTTKLYRLDPNAVSGNHVDWSRTTGGPYGATEATGWSGTHLNGVTYMNNQNDKPQALRPSDATFIDLPNWPSSGRATMISSYKNYVLALGYYNGTISVHNMVKWSSASDPNEVPFTWDETDPTNEAGEFLVPGAGESVVTGAILKDAFFLYKQNSVHSMTYTGGVYVFSFRQIFDGVGAISQNAVKEFEGKHFVVGLDDIYVHNGVEKKSVISGKMKSYFFDELKAGSKDRVFVIKDTGRKEMWVCGVSSKNMTDSSCDFAIVWDWEKETWAIREIPSLRYGVFGSLTPTVGQSWDEDTEGWGSDFGTWGNSNYDPSDSKIFTTSSVNLKQYISDSSTLYDGVAPRSFVEKTYIDLGDDRNVKEVISITPHADGSGVLNFYIGTSVVDNGPISWKGPYSYTLGGSQYKIDFRSVGRYMSVRFESDSASSWSLNGYTAEVADTGGMR